MVTPFFPEVFPSFTFDQKNYNYYNPKNHIQVRFTPCVRSDFNPLTTSQIVLNKLPESNSSW